jgi:exopolysaccharide production protein ExoQ
MIGLFPSSSSARPQFDIEPSTRGAWLTKWPWLTAVFLAVVFILASHDFQASRNWQVTTDTDLVNLTERIGEGRFQRQLAFPALACGALIMILKPGGRRLSIDGSLAVPLILFITWCFASILWSHDRAITIKRLIVFGSVILTAFAFVRQYRFRDVPFCMLVGTTVMLLVGIVCELLYSPGVSPEGYRFAGSQHPNHTGINGMMMSLAGLFFFSRTRNKLFLAVVALGCVIVVLTKSRTAMLGGVAAMVVYLLMTWPLQRAVFVGAVMGLLASGFLGLYMAGLVPPVYEAVLLGRQNADPTTLTGRTDIWAAGFSWLQQDSTRMLTGMGYDSFWNAQVTDYIAKVVRFKISESHNAYIDMIFDLGVIGLVLWLVMMFTMLVSSVRRWWTKNRAGQIAGAFCVAMVAFVLIHGIAEATFVDCTYPFMFFLMLMFLCAFMHPAKAQSAEAA